MGVGVGCCYMTSLCNMEGVWVHSKGDALRESTVCTWDPAMVAISWESSATMKCTLVPL